MKTVLSDRSFSVEQIAISESDDFYGVEVQELESADNAVPVEDKFCREASRRVKWVGNVLLGYMLLTGILCSAGVAMSLKKQEQDAYEEAFYTAASTLAAALPKDLVRMTKSMQVVVDDIRRQQHVAWPYVTLQDFETRGNRINQLLGTEQVTLLPVVRDIGAWEGYAVENQFWMHQSEDEGHDISPHIQTSMGGVADKGDVFLPVWQTFPSAPDALNTDWLSNPILGPSLRVVLETGSPILSPLHVVSMDSHSRQWGSTLFYPILDANSESVVAILTGTLVWENKVYENALPMANDLVETVVQTTCKYSDQSRLLLLTAQGTKLIDTVPQHDLQVSLDLTLHDLEASPCQTAFEFYPFDKAQDAYYSLAPFWGAFTSGLVFGVAVLLTAVWRLSVARRHALLSRQHAKSNALVSSLFPDNIRERLLEFQNSREGGFNQVVEVEDENITADLPDGKTIGKTSEEWTDSPNSSREPPKMRLKSFLKATTTPTSLQSSLDAKPIADFFPNCTVMFADISGFTAWSSQREPHQVFMLLQNLYGAFDGLAKRMNVFKVETIGDSYVSVTGLPDPQKNHALLMARFAVECRTRMKAVCKKLVRTLGPETEDLRMRFGLHSGPVTAGVLRGERSRFQLFGDTVNTAARMESCGERDRIQISEATADLLIDAGKGHMVTPREELIQAKGKGTMRVYWLDHSRSSGAPPGCRRNSLGSQHSSVISFGMFSSQENLMMSTDNLMQSRDTLSFQSSSDLSSVVSRDMSSVMSRRGSGAPPGLPIQDMQKKRPSLMWGNSSESLDSKQTKFRRNASGTTNRLIEWNVALLQRLLKQVVTKRLATASDRFSSSFSEAHEMSLRNQVKEHCDMVSEVAEIIPMPNFEPAESASIETQAMLSLEVENQIRGYVAAIATMYRENPFHNYEHCCHVQMAMSKLLERVVNPDDIDYESKERASDAHNYTYGLTSDPLTQFTVVFCALIHDVDHTGVSNGQLIKEKAHIAEMYHNKSVAEQNSIDLAWDLLMQDEYKALRNCIYTNESEFKRFRQLVVNTVLATDIFDKELSSLRKNRWAKAFQKIPADDDPTDAANRKATIVIEHLIQASDVSHCMQHWDIYRKWNERLFFEMYESFKSGRSENDPSGGWYKGELWFFDNYVIPLAKKLDDCGVFGVCSDECLVYAKENRALWEIHGEKIVQEMISTDYLVKLKGKEEVKRPRRGVRNNKKSRGLDIKALNSMETTRGAVAEAAARAAAARSYAVNEPTAPDTYSIVEDNVSPQSE